MVVGDNGGRWWCGVDKVVMVVGVRVRVCARGRALGEKIPNTERGGSVSGVL